MSLESAKVFVERMKSDEDFRKKVNECKDRELRMNVVKEAGYEFTKQDINNIINELTDNDLNSIVGGLECGYDGCSGMFDYCY